MNAYAAEQKQPRKWTSEAERLIAYRRRKGIGPRKDGKFATKASIDQRFNAKINKVMRVPSLRRGPCWEWQGYCDPKGYGRFTWYGRKGYAHAYGYQSQYGPTPPGMELDHLCRNRCCCNPRHLEAVTHRENLARSPIHPFFNKEARTRALEKRAERRKAVA